MNHNLDFFVSLITKFNWLGNWLFLFISLAECVPFVGSVFPGGTLIYLAGIFAAQGYFKVGDVIIFATLGAIIGDYSGYALGRWGGKFIESKNIVNPKYINKGQEFFNKYGAKSIFWGRFVGATRAFIPFIAGTSKMKQRTFFLWNVAGAIFWAVVHVLLGYFSGNIITEIIRRWTHRLNFVVYICLAAIAIYLVSTFLIKNKKLRPLLYFKKQSANISEQLLRKRWFKKVDARYPVADEFLVNSRSREIIFTWLSVFLGLAVIYFLILILDLF